MFSGAGQLRLDMTVEGNLLRNAAGALKFNEDKKCVLTDEERARLTQVLKHVPIAMSHLRKSLTDDDDFLAVYRLVESAYIVGALTQITDAMPKIAAIAPGSEGGKKGSVTRAEKAANGWRIEGLRLAQEYAAANPPVSQRKRLSQRQIADHICEKYTGDEQFSHESCRKQVAEWIKQGKLQN
jgi:hypothetical protein